MKFLKYLFISFFIVLLPFSKVIACQFDTSVNNYIVKGNIVYANSYFHPFQLEYLLNEKGINLNEIKDIFLYEDVIKNYIFNNINFTNNSELCTLDNFSFIATDDVSIYFDGLGMRYNILCEGVIEKGDIRISFFEEVRKQTNILVLYYGDTSNELFREYLFPMGQIMNFSIDSKYTQKYNSTISDKKIPNNIEQNEIVVIEKDIINEDIVKEDDLDFFIDNDNNFLKLDLENCLSCSENIDEEYIKDNLYYSFLSNKDIDFLNENNFYDSGNSLIGDGFVNNIYKKLVGYLANYLRDDDKSIVILFLIIMAMGFLHAAGPGHTKSILASIMIDDGKKFKDGLVFITSFTISHYLDIIIISLILNILVFHIDITLYVSFLQKIAVFVLFLISLYLLRKSIKGLIGGNKDSKTDSCSCCSHHGKKHNHNHNKSNKTNILLGFSSGIVPCMLGWSILLILTSLGMLQYVFLMIVALAFGTFLFLFIFLLFIGYLKKISYSKISKFLIYTPLFSALLLLIISLSLLFGIIDFN